MKPLLSTAFLMVLGCSCVHAQSSSATVFEQWSHIDDGIFAGPKKRVPKAPPPVERFSPYTHLPELREVFPLDSYIRGPLKPTFRALTLMESLLSLSGPFKRDSRALTLMENLQASRDVKKGTRLKFVSTKNARLSSDSIGESYQLSSLFDFALYPGASSPYSPFTLQSRRTSLDSPLNQWDNHVQTSFDLSF